MILEHCSRESCVQIIEGLQEKYARLHAASCRDDDTIAALREERDKVIAELAAVQARLDAYSWEAENTALRVQVAAAQAENARLRGALQATLPIVDSYANCTWRATLIREALATPSDTAALDARLKDEYLKGFSDGAANYATEAIRSMK